MSLLGERWAIRDGFSATFLDGPGAFLPIETPKEPVEPVEINRLEN
jgi:hypothetical protein